MTASTPRFSSARAMIRRWISKVASQIQRLVIANEVRERGTGLPALH